MTLVRFAPSPTGRLHVGNLRTALMNFLFARKTGGKFLLRIDDTDTERSEARYEKDIESDLEWMGLKWDSFARQSERIARYEEAAARLKSSGHLYPCYETPDELERKRKRRLARGEPPVYDRAALKLSPDGRKALEASGKRPHWRFKLSGARIEWHDLVRGAVHIETSSLSDPVLVREDGRFLYTLPSVVDDIELGVTHVIRGEDHVTNTAVQLQIAHALGAARIEYAHLPLLAGASGEMLSKRLGSLSIGDLRGEGILPMALACLLAKLGTSDPVTPRGSLDELATEFDFAKIGRAPAHFDPGELLALNRRLLHGAPYAEIRPRLTEFSADGGEEFWRAVHDNCETLKDARAWHAILRAPIAPLVEDAAFAVEAAKRLPPEPWSAGTWGAWTKAVGAATGRTGRALYRPLRLALTGREDGPEMKLLLPLLGRARAEARLRGRTA